MVLTRSGLRTPTRKLSPASDSDHPNRSGKKEKSILRDVLDLVGCSVGIYVCYLGYGLLHERIYGVDYDGEKFTYSLFLVGMQCVGHAVLALVCLLFTRTSVTDRVPKLDYFQMGFTYIGAMYASNWALSFVNYPTQALAKSCKLIPVMLMSVVINKTSYSTREYVCVMLLTAGIAVFTLGKAKAKTAGSDNSTFGICLLFASLALDGFTGPSQKKIQDKYSPTSQQMMFNMNVYAILIVGVALVCTGQGTEALAFIDKHPDVLPQMALFSLLSAFGQNFILVTLYRFGPLVLTTITTTRKFFTILCSVVWYGHVLSAMQWLGVGMVFSGLGLDALGKYFKKKAKLANMKKTD